MNTPKLHEDITSVIGNTPIVRLRKFEPEGVKIYAKLESANPGGSVKDRMALNVIEDAERRGNLKPGQTVVEATSGNTGIGLAIVCAQKGYPLIIVMAESFSVERRKLLRFLGAKVVLTPAAEKGTGMVRKAKELADRNGWFFVRQFENEANADAHSKTTALEILEAFEGDRLDYFVSGYGTGGTISGVSRVLKKERPDTRVIACEPDNSPLLTSGASQERNPDGTAAASHPAGRPHLVQGWTPDFIPKLTEDARGSIDEISPVAGNDALEMSRRLARECGILAGISSGATLAVAVETARRAAPGSTVLCMLPDTGERYQSTVLFEDILADMNQEEMAISQSTPSARFDAPPPAAPAPAPQSSNVQPMRDAEAEAFIDKVLNDPDRPVVLFALEWCEFCWSVRKLFKALNIDHLAVDIDAASMQKDNWGGRVRAALSQRTGCATIPQIFVDGSFIGGAVDILEEHNAGRLRERLQRAGVPFDSSKEIDSYAMLPTWLHKRGA